MHHLSPANLAGLFYLLGLLWDVENIKDVYNTINLEEALKRCPYLFKGVFMLFAPQEKGQGLVEYAIIIALVALIVIAVVRLLGPKIGNTFSTINSSLP